VDAVPTGGVQAHAAAPFRGFPVEGLLPIRIQVQHCSAGYGFRHMEGAAVVYIA
jgi:hypothetical protein